MARSKEKMELDMGMTRTPEDRRLDDLATSVAAFMRGWEVTDVARVCTGLTAVAVASLTHVQEEKRAVVLENLFALMREAFDAYDGARPPGQRL